MTYPETARPENELEGPLHQLARSAWQAVLVIGIASMVLGVLVLAWPGPSLLVAGILFGIYLVISGIFQLAAAFGTHVSTPMRVLAFISGALSLLLGIFCFRSAFDSVILLGIWIGIGWLFRGMTQMLAAISDRAMPARGWQIFFGIITVIAGIVLIDSPVRSITVLAVLVGCWLIALGIMEIITAFRIRRHTTAIPTYNR